MEVNTLPSGPYSPPLHSVPAFHTISWPINFIVSPLTFTPKRPSVKFHPKCNPMGSHKSPLRRKAYPNRTPNPEVLRMPSQVELGLALCITPNRAPTLKIVVKGPQTCSSVW